MIATTSWSHFFWQTTLSAVPLPLLKEPFAVRYARADEKEKAMHVALLSLKMNTEWHDATHVANAYITKATEEAFSEGAEPSCLVIAHGQRIIGVSILNFSPEASFHLASGPWVLTEYRNRGLGSALLHASLSLLAKHGISEACGITRSNSTAARFVYPKFGGIKSDATAPLLVSEGSTKK